MSVADEQNEFKTFQNDTEQYRINVLQSFYKKDLTFNPYLPIIDSFNAFIASFPNIVSKLQDTLKSPNGVRINSLSLRSPVHMLENHKEVYTDPYDCIISRTTYTAQLYASCSINHGTTENPIINDICIPIGYIPIMVGCSICNSLKTNMNTIQKYSQLKNGGYFIVNGNIRYTVPQFSAAVNTIIVIFNNKLNNFIAHIRSQSSSTGHSVATEMMIVKDFDIVVKSSFFTTPVPLGAILALLIPHDEFINECKNIIDLSKIKADTKVFFDDVSYKMLMYSKESAEEFLSSKLVEKYKHHNIYHILTSEIFPHHGIALDKERAIKMFLTMFKKLVLTAIKKRKENSRDEMSYKRLNTNGILMTNLITLILRRFMSELNKQINQKTNPSIESLINNLSTLISRPINRAIATGKWSANARTTTSYTPTGITNNGAFTNHYTQLSAMHTVNIPDHEQSTDITKRLIHHSQLGYISSFNTPEGKKSGLQLTLSVCCIVSNHRDIIIISEIVKKIVEDYVDDIQKDIGCDKYDIFVNGMFIVSVNDFQLFIKKFKSLRKKKFIPFDVSIMFNSVDKEIHVSCDEGRLLCPLIVVKNNSIKKFQKAFNNNDISDLHNFIKNNIIEYVDPYEIKNCNVAEEILELQFRIPFTHVKIHPCQNQDLLLLFTISPNCNPSARNVYELAMHKSSIGSIFWNEGITQKSICSNLPNNPLVTTDFELTMYQNMPNSGKDLFVLIHPFNGSGMEDGFIVNKTSLNELLYWTAETRSVFCADTTRKSTETHKICNPSLEQQNLKSDYSHLINGVIKKRTIVKADNTIVIGRITEKDGIISDSSILSTIDGVVDDVTIHKMNGAVCVTVVIRKTYQIKVGNKFATNTAQKGTIGECCNSSDLPFSNSGLIPDLIINPHSLPSRMTVSTVIAGMLGMNTIKSGKYNVNNLFQGKNGNAYQIDMCKNYTEPFYCGKTGKYMGNLPVYVIRMFMLKHLAENKCFARGISGPIEQLTRQPNSGKAHNGAIRFGEMENDAVLGHGAAQICNNLTERSDAHTVCICRKCGIIASFKPDGGKCHICVDSPLEHIRIPWVNVMIQHLFCVAGIGFRMFPPAQIKSINGRVNDS